tara:strand:- start:69 stop:212 length:144 start_codon:yes stop_codon:yes gene_type:complete
MQEGVQTGKHKSCNHQMSIGEEGVRVLAMGAEENQRRWDSARRHDIV